MRRCSAAGRRSASGAEPPPAARLKTLLERPVFRVERPLPNARRIRGSRGGDATIERRRRDAEPLRDLSYSDVGIGEHRLGGLDVVFGEFRRLVQLTQEAERVFGPIEAAVSAVVPDGEVWDLSLPALGASGKVRPRGSTGSRGVD
jgi:hypothetical protein